MVLSHRRYSYCVSVQSVVSVKRQEDEGFGLDTVAGLERDPKHLVRERLKPIDVAGFHKRPAVTLRNHSRRNPSELLVQNVWWRVRF